MSISIWRPMLGFEGRLSRGSFWPPVLGLFLATFIVFYATYFLLSGRWNDRDLDTMLAQKEGPAAFLITFLVLLYPTLVVFIKRMHDLNMSGWWCVPTFAFPLAYGLAAVMDLAGPFIAPNLLGKILTWGSDIFFVALIVILGFIRGTQGPNKHGLDPLGRTPATVARK